MFKRCFMPKSFFYLVLVLPLEGINAAPDSKQTQSKETPQEIYDETKEDTAFEGFQAGGLNLEDVPEYSKAVNETHYFKDAQEINNQATKLTLGSSGEAGGAGQIINESVKTKEEFHEKFSDKSPLFEEANNVLKDPVKSLDGEITQEGGSSEQIQASVYTCEESGDPERVVCTQTRFVKMKLVEKTVYVGRRYQGRRFNRSEYVYPNYMIDVYFKGEDVIYHPRMKSYLHDQWYDFIDQSQSERPASKQEYFNDTRFMKESDHRPEGHVAERQKEKLRFRKDDYFPHTETPIYKTTHELVLDSERIINTCQGVEERSDRGLCYLDSGADVEGEETREFSQGGVSTKIHRPWWRKRYSYLCKAESLNSCGPYRARGCEQIETQCLRRVDGVCVVHKKKFKCTTTRRGCQKVKIKGDVPWCLDGNCDDHTWEENKDFATAMSKLTIFQEMAKDMNPETAIVFPGKDMRCRKHCLGFQDCCGDGGWGKKVGLGSGCSQEEQALQKERQAGKCVLVGTYCAEKDKITRICLRKKTSFCCFGSKLSRILHEQARKQGHLNLPWGSPESPVCRGFYIDELSKIDFEAINFSELFEEILANSKMKSIDITMKRLGPDFQEKIKKNQNFSKEEASGLLEKMDQYNLNSKNESSRTQADQ